MNMNKRVWGESDIKRGAKFMDKFVEMHPQYEKEILKIFNSYVEDIEEGHQPGEKIDSFISECYSFLEEEEEEEI